MISLWRSTPFRLAVLVGGSLLAALAVAGISIYLTVDTELRARVERTVRDQFNEIRRSTEGDLGDLTLEVYGYALAAADLSRIYVLTDEEGQVLAGNTVAVAVPEGWSTLPGSALGISGSTDSYRVLAGPVLDEHLVVAISYAEVEAVTRLVLYQLLWTGGAFVLLIGMSGAMLARRGARRLHRIAETMERVGRGNLAARIPVGRGSSDLDLLVLQLNEALERLQDVVEAMRQVSADIAHELRTPLSRLSLAIEMAAEAEAAGEPVETHLNDLQQEARQLNAVFAALLRIAQIESGARRARFQSFDISPALDALAEAYAAVAEEAGMTLALRRPAHLPMLWGDRELLTQMLANLIENALHHCPPGTGIELVAGGEGAHLRLEVRDTGPGIPEGEHERVFRRLYRLEKSRTTSGSGLGMSLVKAVVDLHGGQVALGDNAPGLVVAITLPLTSGQKT